MCLVVPVYGVSSSVVRGDRSDLLRNFTEFVVGHTGHGCQQVVYDLKNRVSIAYVSNGLKTGLYNLCRTYSRLQNAVYDVVESRLSEPKTFSS
ncbi:unnamed protein product [Strongylus vulgaris]|uniref:Uncharacterized protein n=1 Tax=Strongylus vulgaris TaxID=40348 RepID=A0A3P7KRR3_STRVU|nr:unnamed protein product [Strongylus vulgaris]